MLERFMIAFTLVAAISGSVVVGNIITMLITGSRTFTKYYVNKMIKTIGEYAVEEQE